MPIITFKPKNIIIDVPPDTELLDAARKAGVNLESPCGGEGTCGDCLLRVVEGDVNTNSVGLLSETDVSNGFALACQTKTLNSAITVEVPEQIGAENGEFTASEEETNLLQPEKYLVKTQPEPLAVKWFLNIPKPQLEDGLSDVDRLTREIQKKSDKKEVSYPLTVLRQLADTLRAEDGQVTVTHIPLPDKCHVIDVESGDQTKHNFGIAVDVGTTTVAVQLVNLASGKAISTLTTYNEQISCGLDVISRINYAQRPDRLLDLRKRVLQTINRLIRQICDNQNIKPRSICNGVFAGNTTMIHLLLGLKPEYIRLEPYTPTIREAPYLTAAEVGIEINKQSWLYFCPHVASYVGGDITAGILCTDLAKESEAINLFIDIGTNGELVLGNRDFLMTCACSAGPAFEGGGIKFGMRATNSAINDVSVEKNTGIATYRTIGDVAPKGICGSGMISLLANLFLTGWIDAAGKLNRNTKSTAILLQGRRAEYIIVPEEKSGIGKPITISETDIENIIRAKAAIYSACFLMLQQVDLTFTNLNKIYIAGGFGRYLDIKNAITIGLVPDIPKETYQYIGNSSLVGAYLVLVSQENRQRQAELTQKMTYIELNTNSSYMDQYMGAMFLPHTDDTLFPSVKKVNK